jgi:hypothetical protein
MIKIFMDHNILDKSKIGVRIVDDDRLAHIFLWGKQCDDLSPAFGCELDEASTTMFRVFMMKSKFRDMVSYYHCGHCTEEFSTILECPVCGCKSECGE